MRPEQYQELKLLFSQVLERPLEERESFARELCNGDSDLLPELLQLIRGEGQPSDSLDTALASFPAAGYTPLFSPNQLLLNRFRIVRFLGRGGMGEVYEADDAETGRVALKTIRPEIADHPHTLARFRYEVQCARKATGTNVCRIHEIFSLPAAPGRPVTAFLTMEFLQGITLSERLEAGPLSTAEAEQVAAQICRGLQTIHEAEIIHRDLKSRNIMLAERKRGTEAVLMDFGLAREIPTARAAAVGRSGSTMPGAVVGTPQYMAPEQFEGGPLTPATDIYALGIVLYEMATGHLPFDGATPLAAAVGRAKPLPHPSAIQKGLPQRWDTAIEHCLCYKAEERFQTPAEVMNALTARFVWRMPSAGSWRLAVFVGAIFAIVAALSILRYRAKKEFADTQPRKIAVLAFDDLSHDAVDQAFCDGLVEVLVSQLSQLERFQGALFVVPSSEVRHQNIGTARDAFRIFGVNLVITGSVQRSHGFIHLFVSLIDAKSVVQIRSKAMIIPESDPTAMQSGVVSHIADLLDMQMNPEARHILTAGITTVPGAYDYYVQGYGYLRQFSNLNTINQAIEEFRHALTLDPSYALASAGLAEAYWQKYLKTKDKSLLEKAWVSCNTALKLNDGIAATHNTFGLLFAGTGKYSEAITEYERALKIDPDSRDAFSGLAVIYEKMGNPDKAEATLKQAISIQPDYWNGYVRLATFYKRHGRYTEALTSLQKVTELVPDNPLVHSNLGVVYQLLGRDNLAEAEYKKSLQIRPIALGYSDLGTFYFYRGRYAEAAHLYHQAINLSPSTFDYWGNLGDAYRFLGEKTEAHHAYLRAITLARESLNLNKRDGIAMSSLASYLAKSGDSKSAIECAQRSTALAATNSDIFYDLALTYELSGQRAKALTALSEALSLGYSKTIVLQEPDLASLRTDPTFDEIMRH